MSKGRLFAGRAPNDGGGGKRDQLRSGREQLQLLAGIEVTAKAVERHAEAIGAGIEACEQEEIRRAKQLRLPVVCAPAAPFFYIEMDGTGVPVVKKETGGRAGKVEGQPAHTREVKLGCVFTQTGVDEKAGPFATKSPPLTSPRLNRRAVRLTALQRRLAAWLEPGSEEGRDRRRRRLDLESRRPTLSRRHPNR